MRTILVHINLELDDDDPLTAEEVEAIFEGVCDGRTDLAPLGDRSQPTVAFVDEV